MGTERETLSTTDSNPLKCNDDLNLSVMSSTGVVCGQEGLLPVSFRGGAFTEFFALLCIFEFCVVGGDLVHICRKNICLIAFCQ